MVKQKSSQKKPKSKRKPRFVKRSLAGFSLIEIMVVVAIVSLLSAIALVSFESSRQKSRDVKRLSDMTQMATAMELFFNTNKGYPSAPQDLVPNFTSNTVKDPLPADGDCPSLVYPLTLEIADSYYYYPSPTGGSYILDGLTLYPDYIYYFCLGYQTGSFPPGVHYVSPKGVR